MHVCAGIIMCQQINPSPVNSDRLKNEIYQLQGYDGEEQVPSCTIISPLNLKKILLSMS